MMDVFSGSPHSTSAHHTPARQAASRSTFRPPMGKHGRMESRRDQIIRVSAQLFAAHGIAGTSVRDIAVEVGMLSGSLYHHFPSKDAIASTILGDFLTDLNDRYQSVLPHVNGMRGRLRALIHESIRVAAQHPYATEIYQNERSLHGPDAPTEIAEAVHRAHSFWVDTAQAASESGELRPELDPAEFARMLRESVWWSVRYHREGLAAGAPSITDTLFLVFIDGAALPAAPSPAVPQPGTPAVGVRPLMADQAITDQLDRIEARLDALSADHSR